MCRISRSRGARLSRGIPSSQFRVLASALFCCLVLGGCGGHEEDIPERRPRPVLVNQLKKQNPPHASLVSASVGSWKTEQIGFEVGGRVEFVVEPSTKIEGRIYDKEGELILEGTPIGRLESERYQLQVARAQAEVTRAEQNLLAGQTELEENLPAQIASATASRDLAKTEFERSEQLFARNAGSQSEVERDRANYDSAEAQLRQLDAATKAKAAEIVSLRNGVLQAKQNLRDAQRDLEDCTLYSSYGGQIADISVVPGSVVAAGQAVATLQMMNPIKVELEVSAEDSRRLQQRERLPVIVTLPDGTQATHEGYLYLIDPVADSLTRTFTVTLLVMNQKLADSAVDGRVATTSDIWRLDYKFLPSPDKNLLFVEEKALLEDADGAYLWMITNMMIGEEDRPNNDPLLKVRKLRVTPGDLKIPFLGNWVFQQVDINDTNFDPEKNMVIGELNVTEGEPSDWNGDTVARSSGGQWMLRPGDLVRVDLAGGNGTEGYYVPMNAISRKGGESSIFIVEESNGEMLAKRCPVKLPSESQFATTSSLRKIEPVEPGSLEGVNYVVQGTHYLIDGEAVKVLQTTEVMQ